MKRLSYGVMVMVLVFSGLFLIGCGDSTPSLESGPGSYTVYIEGTAGVAAEAGAGDSADLVIVLPSSASVPANYKAVSHANVTFLQDEVVSDADTDAGSITVTTDDRGRLAIPQDIRKGSQGEEGRVDIVVTLPEGNGLSMGTSLPAAEEDSGESPLSLRIVPGEFMMVTGELRVFHAVKTTPGGRAVKAKNVAWDCDPDLSGVLSKVEEAENGEYVICRAETAGTAEVSGALDAGGGLSATAVGEVISRDDLIVVEGTIKHPDNTPVGPGFLVNFSHQLANRLRPVNVAGHTGDTGDYRVTLPGTQDQRTHLVLIGTPRHLGARLHKAVPFTFTVTIADNGQTLAGRDFSIGAPLLPLPPRPPLERYIRAAWHQVNSAARPRYFEPLHGIRILLSEAVADGMGQIGYPGMFRGWCYDKRGTSVAITPPSISNTCPYAEAHQRIEIAKLSPSYYHWSRYLKPLGAAGFVKTGEGDVEDTVNYSPPYISDILAIGRHNAVGLPNVILFTNRWDWTRTPGGDDPLDDEEVPGSVDMSEWVCSGNNVWTGTDPQTACGAGMPLGTYWAKRLRATEFNGFSNTVTPLFTFYGNAVHYVRRPDGSLKEVANTICAGTPCVISTDGSGEAEVASDDGRTNISFSLRPFNAPGDIIAEGTLTLTLTTLDGTDVDRVFTFTISRFGHIEITCPDGAVEKFPLPVV